MRTLLILITLFYLTTNLAAQNIGIGTASPHASSQLDISSTTRGLLAPRMTTAQRSAIASPAKGLLVYDTDLNALYHYNGAGWAAVGGGGGGFALPFEGSVNLATPGFKVTNAGFGPAIQAVTTNEFGYALQATTTANYGYSLYAYSRSPNGIGVYALGDSSIAVKAESGKGIGVDAISTDSTAFRARIIKGANLDPVILSTHAGAGIAVDASSSTGIAVRGTSSIPGTGTGSVVGINNNATSGVGVYGLAVAAGGIGVRGEANAGTGVLAYSNTNIAVSAGTLSGTALAGNSTSGYALDISGKVQISGGNTNPTAGAVLTSLDASGNAVWQPLPATLPKVAFRAHGVYSSFQSIPIGTFRKIHFASESYDYGNDFLPTTSASPSVAMSSFVVPVTGVYHFDIGCGLSMADLADDFDNIWLEVHGNRSGNIFSILRVESQCCNANLGFAYNAYGSADVRLIAGDIVYVEIRQSNDDNSAATIDNIASKTFFTGRLVAAD